MPAYDNKAGFLPIAADWTHTELGIRNIPTEQPGQSGQEAGMAARMDMPLSLWEIC